ncbi:MAG: PA domain-containing protein [Jiangellaceae bacterium]
MSTITPAVPGGFRRVLVLATLIALIATAVVSATTPQKAQGFPSEAFCSNNQDPAGDASYEGFLSAEEVGSTLRQIERSSNGEVEVEVAGHSNQGREIWSTRVGHGDTVVLVESQIHGNEKHGTRALLNMVRTLGNNSARSKQVRDEITFVAIPNLNMDGGEVPRRQNVMPWSDVMAMHPQLPNQPRAWYYSNGAGGFDVNRDFNPDLAYEPVAGDLPGTSSGVGFYLTPEARTVRDVYRSLEDEFGRVDFFVDLHGQATCYGHGLSNEVVIDGPSSAAGAYQATHATFGPAVTTEGFSGDVVGVNDGSAQPTRGCGPLVDFPDGAIALVDRGTCTFVQKVTNAQAAGAVAVIIANDTAAAPTPLSGTGPDITIPSVMISQFDGNRIKAGLPARGTVLDNPESGFYSPLSISGRFITDPTAHGDWPNFDDDASRRLNVAVYDALQGNGNSPFGRVTAYPQPPSTDIPGTALGSFALRGSAVILFETSSQTQALGPKRAGMLTRQVEIGLTGMIDTITDGTFGDIDPDRYYNIPLRVNSPVQ